MWQTEESRAHKGCYNRQVGGLLCFAGTWVPLLRALCGWGRKLEDSSREHVYKGLRISHHLSDRIPEHGRPAWKVVCSFIQQVLYSANSSYP